MKKHPVLFGVIVGIALLFFAGVFVNQSRTEDFDENNLPEVIQADWIDLDRVSHISKFRSGSGHDFSDGDETCRSMKHYFNVIRTREDQESINKNHGFPPPFTLEDAISIYSPVDGTIVDMPQDGKIGRQMYIQSKQYPEFTIRLFHVFPLDGYEEGKEVSAGEHIGNIGRTQNTDIAVSVGGSHNGRFVSYFQVMPDNIFAKYQSAGVENRDQIIITKEYRDAHPLQCDGEQFVRNYDADGESFVFINGYDDFTGRE